MQKLVWQNANGDSIDLTSGNYGITHWEGFSNTDLNIQSQQVPFQDGGVYLDSLINQRELSVTLKMQDNGNLEERYRMRRELIHILNPKLGEGYLIYTNDFISKRIKCVAQIPLFETHNSDTRGTPKASLSWTACEPYWEDLEETVAVFDENQSVEIINNGDIPSEVEIDISTMNSDSPIIKNLTTDKAIKLMGFINSDVNINTNTGKKSVVGKASGILPQIAYSNLDSVFYVEKKKKYFALGDDNYQFYAISDDGENWRYRKLPPFKNFAYSDILGYFICVTFSYIYKSFDGENWESAGSHNIGNYLAIDYSNKLGIFLGAFLDKCCVSVDGITWKNISVDFDSARNVQWVEQKGLFYISTWGDYSYTWDGITFERISLPSFYKIKYINELNLYITTTTTTGTIRTSADGITWTAITIADVEIRGILWTGEKILASGYKANEQKNKLYESTDGINFTFVADTDYEFNDGIKIGEEYIVVGNKGLIEKSSDGESWEAIKYNPSPNNDMSPVYFTYCNNNNKTYALFENGNYPLLSTIDGLNWKTENSASNLQRMQWIKEKNIFVGFNGSQIVSSADAENWTNRLAVTGCGKFCYSKKLDKIYSLYLKYNSTSNKTEFRVLTSSNGTTWTDTKKLEITGERNGGITEIAYSEKLNIFLAYAEIGETKYLFKSTDGSSWTSSTITNTVWSLFRVERDGYFYYCQEKLYRSTDGTSWEAINLGNDVYLRCGCFSEELGLYCLIANYVSDIYNPASFYSPDGVNWKRKEYNGNGTNNFAEIIYSPYSSRFITGNTFLISASDTTGETENLINQLSQDSDIGFNLDVGNNKIVYTQVAGKANVTITYRQKYIGV